jgi:hypothetical protein
VDPDRVAGVFDFLPDAVSDDDLVGQVPEGVRACAASAVRAQITSVRK